MDKTAKRGGAPFPLLGMGRRDHTGPPLEKDAISVLSLTSLKVTPPSNIPIATNLPSPDQVEEVILPSRGFLWTDFDPFFHTPYELSPQDKSCREDGWKETL